MKIFGFVNTDGAAALLNTAPLLAAVTGLMPAPYTTQANAPPDGAQAPILDPRRQGFVFNPVCLPLPSFDGGVSPLMSEAAVGRAALYLGQA